MEKPDDVQPVEVDAVLPPEEEVSQEESSDSSPVAAVKKAFPGVLARVLDEFFVIPNSRFRIGFDPIIGFFFPGIGDAITATLGALIVGEGVKRGVPKPVLMRMGMNVLLNAGIGAIPIIGDLFSVWFKSNAQNHALLIKHTVDTNHPTVRPSMLPLFGFLLAVFGVITLVITGFVFLFRWLF